MSGETSMTHSTMFHFSASESEIDCGSLLPGAMLCAAFDPYATMVNAMIKHVSMSLDETLDESTPVSMVGF